MKIESSVTGGTGSLILRGEFETESADSFLTTCDELLAGGTSRIAVSFRYVKYINSTALGSVVRARTKCKARGGDLVITRPSKLTRQVVEGMGLDSVLLMYDDEEEGHAFLQGDGGGPTVADPDAPPKVAQTPSEQPHVMFSFDDQRGELFPGRSRHGVAMFGSVNPQGLMFSWNPTEHGCSEDVVAKMFPAGSFVHCKLQLKLIRKEFFRGDVTVQSVTTAKDGTATVACVWRKLAAEDLAALERHTSELDFLRREAENPAKPADPTTI